MLPTNAQERKDVPIFSGVLRYFPNALAYVAHVSKVGNDQHNPGQPLHWAKEKSTDEADALVRHQMEAGTFDVDGVRHSGKVAWRALAQLERELEEAEKEENLRKLMQRGPVLKGVDFREGVEQPSTGLGTRAFHPRGAHPGTPCNSCRPNVASNPQWGHDEFPS